jgi:hypothetical protein
MSLFTNKINIWRQNFAVKYAFLKVNFWAKFFFFFCLLIPIISIILMVIVLPIFMYSSHETELNVLDSKEKFYSTIKDTPEQYELSNKLIQLKAEEVYLRTQLQLAKMDSINLAINLADSQVVMQIRGVAVRVCHIKSFTVSRLFTQFQKAGALLPWIANPFTLQETWATLPKSPIKIKYAPRDTLEANQRKSAPIDTEKSDVYVKMQFDRNLVVEIKQEEPPSPVGRLRKWYHEIKIYSNIIVTNLKKTYTKEQPPNPLSIELILSHNDAKAVYRAIPRNALLALKVKVL